MDCFYLVIVNIQTHTHKHRKQNKWPNELQGKDHPGQEMQMDPAYFPAAPTEQLILDTWVCSQAPQFTCSYRLLLGPGVLRARPFPRPEPPARTRRIVLPLPPAPRWWTQRPSAWRQSAAHPYLESAENTALLKFNSLPPQRTTRRLSSATIFAQAQAPPRASWTEAG